MKQRQTVVFRAIWLTPGFVLILGLARERVLRERALAPLDGAKSPWDATGFQANGVHPTTTRGALPRHIEHRGSWLDTDEWQGRASTVWLRAPARQVRVCVAGYPQHAGCRLWVEFRGADGAVRRITCPLENPHEEWKSWDLLPPAGTTALRVATLALTLTLVWGPGMLWITRSAAPEMRFAAWLLMGPLVLALMGSGRGACAAAGVRARALCCARLRVPVCYEPGTRVVKFSFVWWNSPPFGMGLGL